MFKKVVVAGLGFIGGSLAISIKKRFPDVELIGITRNVDKVKSSINSKYIDFITDYSNLDIIRDASFAVICSSVSSIPDVFYALKPFISESCIITDVGSVKEFIVKSISYPRFVGSHPMAGSDRSGFENSDPSIFDDALSVITPFNNENNIVQIVADFWKFLGMKVLIISPEDHDKIVAQSSHFVHLVAYAISYTLSNSQFAQENFKGIFGKGLLDTTRISKGDPELWIDIISKNKDNVFLIFDEFIKNLYHIRELLSKGEFDILRNIFEVSKNFRKKLD